MRLLLPALLVLLAACSSQPKAPEAPPDEFVWLEEVQGEKPLAWVKEMNRETEKNLESLPAYKRNEREIRKILLATDRLPMISQRGKYVFNFWQDEKAVRGLWRRTTLESFKAKSPKWEIVLDLDKLSKDEKENWVWKGSECLPPEYQHCMLKLSRGGKDASVLREFDTVKKAFVKDGFFLPEAKSQFGWVDKDTLIVATDFGAGSLTSSGYPRLARIWKRGQKLADLPNIAEAKPSDVSIYPFTMHTPKSHQTMVSRSITFYSDETFEVTAEGKLKKIPKPDDAQMVAWLGGHYIIQLRTDWNVRGETFKAGSVVSLPLMENGQPKNVFVPSARQSVGMVAQTKDALIINYMDSVTSKIARAHLKGDAWVVEQLPFPDKGEISISSVDEYGDLILASFENFLTPNSILAARAGMEKPASGVKVELIKQLPARFDSSPYKVEQLWANSADGTQVPYFMISRKDMQLDGKNAVLIYGYGGFEVSQGPYYPTVTGKSWLEKGGVYVLANIRGGGEFGPQWHQAALKENRQRAFDDFIAVGEDLVKRKVSQPAKMAISGGSNGGLLVGATFTQRPDLFAAVICKVPLLDMLKYNKLLAGASWEAEYGNPDDPALRPAILKYSPYQNVKAGMKYPEVFFITSTMDDRVHPGHARKMVAKMKAQGHPLLYFENTEGGHSAAANLLQKVKFSTLEYTFLQDRLLKSK